MKYADDVDPKYITKPLTHGGSFKDSNYGTKIKVPPYFFRGEHTKARLTLPARPIAVATSFEFARGYGKWVGVYKLVRPVKMIDGIFAWYSKHIEDLGGGATAFHHEASPALAKQPFSIVLPGGMDEDLEYEALASRPNKDLKLIEIFDAVEWEKSLLAAVASGTKSAIKDHTRPYMSKTFVANFLRDLEAYGE